MYMLILLGLEPKLLTCVSEAQKLTTMKVESTKRDEIGKSIMCG